LPQISDRQWIQNRLENERPWTAYALADLEPGYFEHTSWFRDPEGLGLILLYRGFSTPLICCIEDCRHFELILSEIDSILDTADRYLVSKLKTLPQIRSKYQVQEERPMLRMTLDAGHYRSVDHRSVARLGPGDLQAVRELYGEAPPDFFLDRMLEDGIYYGMFEDSDLISIAGTHIVSRDYGVGGVGNVYTRADRRSHGYATIVTSAVSEHLLRMKLRTIVLNVRQNNDAAIRIYERLGYQPYCRYIEMVAVQPRKIQNTRTI
jgi:GNAT superfamily N-acetyltransferase